MATQERLGFGGSRVDARGRGRRAIRGRVGAGECTNQDEGENDGSTGTGHNRIPLNEFSRGDAEG